VAIVEGPEFAARASAPGVFAGRAAAWLIGFLAGAILLAALQLHYGWLDTHSDPPPKPEPRVIVAASSINDALAQAHPGDTVEVPAGEYREQITLREGVNVVSRVPLEAIVRRGVVSRNIKSARVSGLRILGDEADPLRDGVSLSDSDVTVEDCDISGAQRGIVIVGGRPLIRANTVQDSSQTGLAIGAVAVPWISHNNFVRNAQGILIDDGTQPVLVGNTFADNRSRAISIPHAMDPAPIRKFNFFLNGKAVVQR